MTRQIVLDTETTGLDPAAGHRIIEIGCVEIINRRPTQNHFHQYLQPDREVDEGAFEVHGISDEFLQDKPRFEDVVDQFLTFIKDAELIIHNAPFDVGFINHELSRLQGNSSTVSDICTVTDTLAMARRMHPGQKNNLDALCKRYAIDNSRRELHGALLDAEILADLYLVMTGGQATLFVEQTEVKVEQVQDTGVVLSRDHTPLRVIAASAGELEQHHERLLDLDKHSGGDCVWRSLETAGQSPGGADYGNAD